jgi:hypothetical protein
MSCGESSLVIADEQMATGAPFVKVAREGLAQDVPEELTQGLNKNGGVEGVLRDGNDNFYIAIHKNELGKRWFMSAYLEQYHPSANIPVRTLGTRVVTFKIQNGKLYAFDASEGKAWSDALDPTVILEAYPIVKNFAPFNRLRFHEDYVLFDPSAGLNRFGFVSDHFADDYEVRFQVDLSFMQRYRALADGVAFQQVFTGYSEIGDREVFASDQPFRASGTLGVALRRYSESADFVAQEMTDDDMNFFGSSNWQTVKNVGGTKRNLVKWNIKPGMQPIQWRISKEVALLQADPRLEGVNLYAAFARGVERWNDVFGFKVFEVVTTTDDDSPGDDDKNFIVVDPNPSASYAFANWRENPNTGEIRGASVYFSSVFVEGAIATAPEETPEGATLTVHLPAAPKHAPRLGWKSMPDNVACMLERGLSAAALPAGSARAAYIEDDITHTVLHEVGHVLGLRHNFMGSLQNSSVMDYLRDEDAVKLAAPGAYDTAALRFLYSLDQNRPTQLFCTDQHRFMRADCSIFDASAAPLTDDAAPAFEQGVVDLMSLKGNLYFNQIFPVTRYVRGGNNAAQKLQAFNILMGRVAPPLSAETVALSPRAALYGDLLARVFLRNLYLDPKTSRDEIATNPSLSDPAFRARLLAITKDILVNSDGYRTFESRRMMVDLLKLFQTLDSYQTLLDARAVLVEQRTAATDRGLQLALEDLMSRVDAASSPYFVK